MLKIRNLAASVALTFGFTAEAIANPCDGLRYQKSSAAHLEAGSVSNNKLDDHFNATRYSHGIKSDIKQIDGNLRIDIVSFPGDSQLAAGLFFILQVTRLAQDDFERVVLVEQGKEVFSFDGMVARENGCQALWGVSTAGSPLPLFVDIMGSAKDADGNALISTYTGNWLSDMNLALEAFNSEIAPAWIFNAAE